MNARLFTSLIVALTLSLIPTLALAQNTGTLIEAPLSPPSFMVPQDAPAIPAPVLTKAEVAELLARARQVDAEYDRDYNASAPGSFDGKPVSMPSFKSRALTTVNDTTTYPYNAVVKLTMWFDQNGYQAGVCSGAIIAPGWVMTAGHCVYSHDYNRQIQGVEIVPGKSGYSEPYGKTYGERVYYFSQWSSSMDYNFDISIIKMQNNLNNFTLGWTTSNVLRDYYQTTYTAGYPAEQHDGYTMYSNACDVNTATSGVIFLNCISEGGQSGSSSWWLTNGTPEVIGVLSFGTEDNLTGIIRLRPEVIAKLYQDMGNCTNACEYVGESECADVDTLRYCTWGEESDYCFAWSARSCPDNSECHTDRCSCMPQCDGKQCGDDGCGGDCGGCTGSTPICDESSFTCVTCVMDGHCNDGFTCEDGTCVMSDECIAACQGMECGRASGCDCGFCPDDKPICTDHLCHAGSSTDGDTPTDGDEPTDGDTPSDGDTPDSCVGVCSLADAPFCLDSMTFCRCDGRQWIPQNCLQVCQQNGQTFNTCYFDPTTSLEGCQCYGDPTDGDAADGDEPTDGDDDGGLTQIGDGGCQQQATTAGGFFLLAGLLFALWRRRATR